MEWEKKKEVISGNENKHRLVPVNDTFKAQQPC